MSRIEHSIGFALGLLRQSSWRCRACIGARGVLLALLVSVAGADDSAVEARKTEWTEKVEAVRHLAKKDLPGAIAKGRELLAIIAEEPDPAAELQLLNSIARPFMLAGRSEEGIGFATRAAELARQLGNRGAEGTALYNQMVGLQQLGRTEEALVLGPTALKALREVREDRGLRLTLALQASLHRRLGQFDSAVSLYSEALTLAQDAKHDGDQALIQNGLGSLYGDSGRLEDAMVHFERAAAHFKAAGDLPPASTVLGNLGLAAIKLGRFDQSIAYFEQAVQIKRQVRDQIGLPVVLNGLAEAQLAKGQIEAARATVKEAIELQETQKSTYALPSSYGLLAKLNEAEGKREDAEKNLYYGLEVAKKSSNTVLTRNLHQQLADFYERRDGTPPALEHAKSVMELEQKLAGEKAQQRMAELDAKFKTAQKDSELAALRLQSQQQSAELAIRETRQRFFAIAGGTAALALFITGALLFQLRKHHARLRTTHRDLEEAMDKLASAQQQLLEASRRAGAADVATGVLHHVGNKLNSVNVSVGLLNERLETSRVTQIGKAADLLAQQSDPSRFLSEDERGRQMIPYLTALARHVQQERHDVLSEVAHLRGHVDELMRVLQEQHDLVHLRGMEEAIPLREWLDAAAAAVDRESAEVRLEWDDLPDVAILTDRYKATRLLVDTLRALQSEFPADRVAGTGWRVRVLAADETIAVELTQSIGDRAVQMEVTDLFRPGSKLHDLANVASELRGRMAARIGEDPTKLLVRIDLPTAPIPVPR